LPLDSVTLALSCVKLPVTGQTPGEDGDAFQRSMLFEPLASPDSDALAASAKFVFDTATVVDDEYPPPAFAVIEPPAGAVLSGTQFNVAVAVLPATSGTDTTSCGVSEAVAAVEEKLFVEVAVPLENAIPDCAVCDQFVDPISAGNVTVPSPEPPESVALTATWNVTGEPTDAPNACL
jgi:hypothetical protein